MLEADFIHHCRANYTPSIRNQNMIYFLLNVVPKSSKMEIVSRARRISCDFAFAQEGVSRRST